MLSPLIRWLSLPIDVPWTANQLIVPISRPVLFCSRNSVISVLVSEAYCTRSAAGLRRYACGERLMEASVSSPLATVMVPAPRLLWARTMAW